MRIAVACDWFAPRRGGIETQLLELATRLGARGHRVDVLTSTPGPAVVGGCEVRRLDAHTLPGTHLAFSPLLVSALRRELRGGYDVVHSHVSVVSPLGYAAAAVARSLGLPTVVTFHSVLRHKRHLLRVADLVAGLSSSGIAWTAVSALVASQLRDALPGARVDTLSNGIDIAFWRQPPRPARPNRPDVTLISAMRLHRKKRPHELVRAFLHAAGGAPARLLLVGDGPERAAIASEISSASSRTQHATVELLGWRTPAELRALYAQADGFVSASRRESFGIAALEARAAGLPVIAMREAGSSEFLDDDRNAILAADDAELTRALARFMRDPAVRARLASDTTSLDRYDWSVVLAEHETTYRAAMALAAERAAVALST